MAKSKPNNALTTAAALVGGSTAIAVIGTGVGVVGTFGALGIGAFEIFTGGALLSGIAAHKAQERKISKKRSKGKRSKAKVTTSKPSGGFTKYDDEEIFRLQDF